MTYKSAFKTPEGETAYLTGYNAALNLWSVHYEEIEIPTRFGMTHVVICGPKESPPLVLLHGMSTALKMWSPNIANFSKNYWVYAVDVMTQPGKSIPNPDEPIRDRADFLTWLQETMGGLNLDRISLSARACGYHAW
jgi:pimeloyl-ACP methyl ester carboxylesterase